ncbi:MAG: hypothetical protein M0R80_25845 [Proteobacteria bacterium]|jgi:hypothetical protein|nr:hypothetical protein [Pseudomonadota bacterium]
MTKKDLRSDPSSASGSREGSAKSISETATSAVAVIATGGAAIAESYLSGSPLPIISGVAALLDRYSTERTTERLRSFVAEVEDRLGQALAHVNQLEDHRQDQVVRILLEARFASEREKLGRLRNAMANAIAANIEDFWFGALHECLTQVTTTEALVLRAFYGIPESARVHVGEGDTGFFPAKLVTPPSPDVASAMPSMIRRLVQLGLIEDQSTGRFGGPTANSMLEKTALGRRFLWLVTDEPGTPMPE